jgi:hypothetical protein
MQKIGESMNGELKKSFLKFDQMVILLFGIGLYFAIFTLTYLQWEDMGQFLSETAVLARGQNLYRDIFEIKDPLFFVTSTLSTLLIGRSGPYIVDAIAVALAAPIAYVALKSLSIDKFKSAVGAVLFVGTLSGAYFQSFRTGTVCLVLILCSIIAVNNGRLFTTGVIFAAVFGLKMPYIPFLVCPFVLGLKYLKTKWNFLRLISGFLSTILVIAGVLHMRGELIPYFEMVRINFKYREMYPAIVGFNQGISGYIDAVNRNGSSATLLILVTICSWLLVLTSNTRKNWYVISSLAMLQLSVLFVIFTTAMWVHHLQMLCLFGFATYALAFTTTSRSLQKYPIYGLLVLVLIGINFQTVGFRIPIKPQQPIADVIQPKWITPPEATYVIRYVNNSKKTIYFARLGPNDDLGLVSFLPNNWKLACPEYVQGGLEDVKWISKITACMTEKPEIIFVSPGFFSLTRPAGYYELLKSEAKKVLVDHYFCFSLPERPGAEICEKKNGSLQSSGD